ncbi:DegT/DnrJ/EryC1/StrS family aminotransferase [Butyrivibrio sp. YAB3001]|uniref:DegT/DnrJ/EryC1/StrS family aminotransferase n=1 Tax=Butyrivibrio sp. YAB3001 TaxID=1520812 RepID=UPI0008F676BC|nr:DegT/DnrJ/EryC1/StrS family aminotransferase [Butyrivibrio sp. YAB3001]SFB94560.1 dTDP-4-amino-4,6-dideoxygalactose transaminase [Butyrivibrio sp. YAB3001]
MKIPFFDLSRQYELVENEIEAAVLEVMRSTQYVEGKAVKEFEKAVAEYIGVKHAITCGNGTDALRIALLAVGIKPGDEVITSAFSFFATPEAIAQIGAVPVFADVNNENYNVDVDSIRSKITSKTKAILPVHIFGTPADMDEINKIGEKYGIPVIEDACQAIGASYKGKKAGNLGTLGCFSFYPTKNLGGFGDGGMITTNSDELANICRCLKAHAAGKQAAIAYEKLYGKEVPELAEMEKQSSDPLYDPCKYYNYFIAGNSRLDSIQAAVLNVKLGMLELFNDKRAAIAKKYKERIDNKKITVPPVEFADRVSCFHQFAVLVEDKEGFIKYLNDNGIGAGNFYPVPLHKQRAFEALGAGDTCLKVAEKICGQTVCLPIFPELTDEEVGQIIKACNEY